MLQYASNPIETVLRVTKKIRVMAEKRAVSRHPKLNYL